VLAQISVHTGWTEPLFLSGLRQIADLFALQAGRDSREKVGALKEPRVVHRLVTVNDNFLVAVGSAGRTGNSAVVEALVPASGAKTSPARERDSRRSEATLPER
jgi:hypothetical protein